MWSRTAPTTAGCVVFAASIAFAQRDSVPSSARDRVSVVAGFADGQRRDAAVSPLAFAGAGFSSTATYDHVAPRATIEASATWDAQRFRPIGRVVDASEQVAQGGARVALLRRLVDLDGWSFSFGGAVAGWGVATEHQYADPNDSHASFLATFATLGPAISAQRPLASGLLRLDADAPAAGAADRSYSAANTGTLPLQLHPIGPRELHAVNAGVSYVTAPHQGLGLVYAYRCSLLTYQDAQPLRTASQALSIGLVRHFGGSRP